MITVAGWLGEKQTLKRPTGIRYPQFSIIIFTTRF